MKKVFVTGGAGYIGAHLVLALKKAKYQVTVFDNLSTGFKNNLPKGVKFIKGDIRDMAQLKKAMFGGYDAVIHLAAKKSVMESMAKPREYAETNITGTLNVLKVMAEKKINKFIFSSTAVVYGHDIKPPFKETDPTNPDNFYGLTKLEIEKVLPYFLKIHKIHYASLRYFNAAGYDPAGRIKEVEKDPQNLLPIIMEIARGKKKKLFIYGDNYDTKDGTCVRDYVHVTDLADAHIQVLRYLDKHEKVILNLGSEKGHSVKDVINMAEKVIKKKIPREITKRREGDPPILYASSKLAKKKINYKAKNSDLKTIISTMWETYHRA
jgi:UDP-glucose 4-epimerase